MIHYRPEFSAYYPAPRTRAMRRARLFIGGTYFRAREPSLQSNNISIQLLDGPGKLIVTNHNTMTSENVVGPVTVNLLEQQLDWTTEYKISALTAAPIISIRSQISFGNWTETVVGGFLFSQLLHIPSKLSAKLTPKLSEITPSSTVIFKSRTRVYDLVPLTVTPVSTDPLVPAGPSVTGWNPAALRAAMANDPWVEMLPRSGTPLSADPLIPAVPLAVKFDVQDDSIDDTFLSAFPDTYMTGGDGLPDFPVTSTDDNDPTTFMIHTAFSEQQDGSMESVYDMYEWVGEWKRF